jgi:nicotinamide-nucleotide amidase
MKALVESLIEHGLTIGTVESFTGGLFASRLTAIAGVSRVYRGSLIAYAEEVKSDWLELDASWLSRVGTISAECALAMAQAGQRKFNTDVCIALTGNAGPTAQENQPVGQWYACIVVKNQVIAHAACTPMDRNALRESAVETCSQMILEWIRKNPDHGINL